MALLESKKQLIEAINADITNNGKKGITGDTLNLILNSIVELMGTGSGGGGNTYFLPSALIENPMTEYTFDSATGEDVAFLNAVADLKNTQFALYANMGGVAVNAPCYCAMDMPTDGSIEGKIYGFGVIVMGQMYMIVVEVGADGSVVGILTME